MKGNPTNVESEPLAATAEFKPARFPIELGLPPANKTLLNDAKVAVREVCFFPKSWPLARLKRVE
jgi:hypothetical protein